MAVEVEIEREAVGNVTILAFKGEFDIWNLPEAREFVSELIGTGARMLVLNLGGLTFMTSSALGFLIKTQKDLKTLDGDLVFAAPSSYFVKTITTLGIDRIFKIFPGNEDAVKHFGDG